MNHPIAPTLMLEVSPALRQMVDSLREFYLTLPGLHLTPQQIELVRSEATTQMAAELIYESARGFALDIQRLGLQQSLPLRDAANKKGELQWGRLLVEQGWNELSRLVLLETFVREHNLFGDFAQFAQKAADEENTLDTVIDIERHHG